MNTRSMRMSRQLHAGREAHVVERVAHALAPVRGRRCGRGSGTRRIDRRGLLRARAPRSRWARSRAPSSDDLAVERRRRDRWRSASHSCAARSKSSPFGAIGPAAQIGERRSRRARPGRAAQPASIGQVAQRQPALDDRPRDGGAGVFDGAALRAAGAEARDDGERHVLGADARRHARRRRGCACAAGATARWSASSAHAPLRTRRCRRRRRRARRGWRCGCRRRR